MPFCGAAFKIACIALQNSTHFSCTWDTILEMSVKNEMCSEFQPLKNLQENGVTPYYKARIATQK